MTKAEFKKIERLYRFVRKHLRDTYGGLGGNKVELFYRLERWIGDKRGWDALVGAETVVERVMAKMESLWPELKNETE